MAKALSKSLVAPARVAAGTATADQAPESEEVRKPKVQAMRMYPSLRMLRGDVHVPGGKER